MDDVHCFKTLPWYRYVLLSLLFAVRIFAIFQNYTIINNINLIRFFETDMFNLILLEA